MKCQMCHYFHLSLKHTKNSDGVKARVCSFNWKEVTPDNTACDDFRLYHLVFCPFEGRFLQRHIDACIYRQKIKRCRCKMGIEIKKHLQSKLVGKSAIKRRRHE